MEHLPAFDLNRAIHDWRTGLSTSPALQRDGLDELESHLRDSIAMLAEKGLSEEEAFLMAVRRCGAEKELQAEFSNPMSPGLSIVFTSLLVTVLVAACVLFLSATIGQGPWYAQLGK